MDLEVQKVFIRSALNLAISGNLNLNSEQLINMYEECSVMALNVEEIESFVVAHLRLAKTSYELSRFDKVLKSSNILLLIFHFTGDKKGEAFACDYLGRCFHFLGQYDKAVKHHKKSLKIAREIGDKVGEGGQYLHLGNCYYSLGQRDKALKNYEMSLNVSRQIGDKSREGSAHCSLGSCYNSLGQYDKALKHYEMSLNILRQIGDKAREGSAYLNLGSCYDSLGQYNKAVKHYEMSLNIARQIADKAGEGIAYANLGCCYGRLEQYDRALEHHEMSLNILRQTGDKAGERTAYGNLGICYHFLGQYNKALKYYELSLKISREIGDKVGEGHQYVNLGNFYRSLGQYDKAVKHYEMGLKIARDIGSKVLEGNQYGNLGVLYYNLKQFDKAVWKLKEGLQCFEDLFQTIPQMDELKISARETFSQCYDVLVDALVKQDKANEALVYCERGRARALIDLMHFKYFLHGHKTEENVVDLAAVRKLVTSLQKTVLYLALTNEYIYIWIIQINGCINFKKSFLPAQRKDQYRNDVIVSLSEQINLLISKFRNSSFPTKCEDRSLSLLCLKTEGEQLNDEKRPKLCPSSVDPTVEVDENLFPKECTKEFHDTDSSVRNPFQDEEDAETSALQTLHQILLAPVQDYIEGKEVVIIPQGSLHLVPFAALLDERGHYVAESLRVRIFPSLNTGIMILENELSPNDEMKPLIVGDPDTGCFPRLPCAKEEARMVATLFNTKPVIGGEATKEKVLLSIENASLIHIAAHGNMERGEILLARNPTGTDISTEPEKEDNMLLMTDLEQKRIKAKLVVLSCCHSARGKVTADGVVGIARAFLGAGARSVLVALWAINDGATLYFMERFYEHLAQGESAGESLSEAMAAMRASGK